MTCAEFKELAALLALGSLEGAERDAAEAHLLEPAHQGCFEALREASAGMEALARSLPARRPGASLFRGIEARISPPPAIRRREGAAWAAAAAAVLLLVGGGARERRRQTEAVAGLEREKQEKLRCMSELSSLRGEAEAQRSAIALLQSPTATLVSMTPQAAGAGLGARVLVDLVAGKGVVLSSALLPRTGKDFQLWIIRGKGNPIPAGLLRAGRSGAVLAPIDPLLLAGGADALAISIEPQGGSPTGLPTGDVVLVGALPKS